MTKSTDNVEPTVPMGRRKLLDLDDAEIPSQVDELPDRTFCPSAEARFRWARQHEEYLIADVQNVMALKPFVLKSHHSEDRREWWLTIEFTDALPLLRWALMLGDTIHSYRVSLDHVMWEMATRASGPGGPPKPRTVSFPIYENEQKFANWKKRLGIDFEPIVWERIELLQPYTQHEQFKGIATNLALLSNLNNMDKHRVVPMVAFAESSGALRGRFEPQGVPWTDMRVLPEQPLCTGAEMMRLRFEQPMTVVELDAVSNLEAALQTDEAPGHQPTTLSQLLITLRLAVHYVLHELSTVFSSPWSRDSLKETTSER